MLFKVSEVVTDGRNALARDFINPAGVAAWLLQLMVLTLPGVVITSLVIGAALLHFNPDQPWVVMAAPIYLIPLVLVAFIFMLLSTFTDLGTGWIFARFVNDPDPSKLSHRIGYFLLSVPVWILVGVIFGGDGGGSCSGSVRYCG